MTRTLPASFSHPSTQNAFPLGLPHPPAAVRTARGAAGAGGRPFDDTAGKAALRSPLPARAPAAIATPRHRMPAAGAGPKGTTP